MEEQAMTAPAGSDETDRAAPAPVAYGALEQRIGYHLRRAQIAVFADFFRTFEAHDIRPVQYSALTVIENNPGLLQTQVADALGIKKANFVAVVAGLVKRGLIRRIVQKSDRRSYGLYLTPAGAGLMPVLHALAEAHEQRIIERIGGPAHARLFGLMKAIEML